MVALTVRSASQFICVRFTDEDRALVSERAAKRGVLNSRTIMAGDGNDTGFAGELAFARAYPQAEDRTDNLGFDFVLRGAKIDVKSKRRTVNPRVEFDCTVPAYSVEHQTADAFVFASVLRPKGSGIEAVYLVGWTDLDHLKEVATVVNNHGFENGTTFFGDHYLTTIDKLYPMDLLLSGPTTENSKSDGHLF